MDFKENPKKLLDLINNEYNKWATSSPKCKTFIHISKIKLCLFTCMDTSKNKNELAELMYFFQGTLSLENLKKCFKKKKKSKETKKEVELNKIKAITLFGNMCTL